MKKYALIATLATFFVAPEANAAVAVNRAALTASLSTSFTDTYSDYGVGFQTYTDAAMTAKKGQTSYITTSSKDTNYIVQDGSNYRYCSGCNGSFTLDFSKTSFGTTSGVFGAGFDIVYTTGGFAFVTFGDGATANYTLSGSFFGLTSDTLIRSIAIGGLNGAASASFATSIDNLTIGSAAVPEPATWVMMMVGFAMVGGAARYRRRGVKVTYA